MSWWEILLIIRGYDWRNVLQYQLQRLQAFCAMFAFSGNKKNLEPEDVIPLYCDRYKKVVGRSLSDDEVAELMNDIRMINENSPDGQDG